MYDSADDFVRDEMKEKNSSIFRLGEVVDYLGMERVQLYGEETPRKMEMGRLYSYSPAVGDEVLVAKVGAQYIILGKVGMGKIH